MDGNLILLCKFNCPYLQDFRPQACHFQHLIIGDFLQFSCLFVYVGIGGVDPIHVREDFAHIRFEGCRHGHCCCVWSAAAQRRDIPVIIDSLKTRDDNNLTGLYLFQDFIGIHMGNPSLAICTIGLDWNLMPQVRLHIMPRYLYGHWNQRNADLLAGRDQDIQLSPIGERR